MKIATYTINGISVRLNEFLEWLNDSQPDIVCLQEMNVLEHYFPINEINAIGYNAVWRGTKIWKGMAILTKNKFEDKKKLLNKIFHFHKPYLEVMVDNMMICCYPYPKSRSLPIFKKRADQLLNIQLPAVLICNFNHLSKPVNNPHWEQELAYALEMRMTYRRLLQKGWVDVMRAFCPEDSTNNPKDDFYNILEKQGVNCSDQILVSPNLKSSLLSGGMDPIFNSVNEKRIQSPMWIEFEKKLTIY